jgi:hypothetical protein
LKNDQIKVDRLTTLIFIELLCVKLVRFANFVRLVKPDKLVFAGDQRLLMAELR